MVLFYVVIIFMLSFLFIIFCIIIFYFISLTLSLFYVLIILSFPPFSIFPENMAHSFCCSHYNGHNHSSGGNMKVQVKLCNQILVPKTVIDYGVMVRKYYSLPSKYVLNELEIKGKIHESVHKKTLNSPIKHYQLKLCHCSKVQYDK